MNWRQYAACKGMDPEVFFPDAGRNERVKKLCDPCSVKAQCLEFARVTETPRLRHGIWGGTSANEREVMFDGKSPVIREVKPKPQPIRKPVRTSCKHGHDWVEENLCIRSGRTVCRQCELDRNKARNARNVA